MVKQRLLLVIRFLTGPLLAILQFEILWGVCNSYTVLVAHVVRKELSVAEVLPDLARATALTGLFLVVAGMLWSWATKIEGTQAMAWFTVFAAIASLSPLVTHKLEGLPTPIQIGLPIRLVLAVAIAAAFYLGSSLFRMVRERFVVAE